MIETEGYGYIPVPQDVFDKAEREAKACGMYMPAWVAWLIRDYAAPYEVENGTEEDVG